MAYFYLFHLIKRDLERHKEYLLVHAPHAINTKGRADNKTKNPSLHLSFPHMWQWPKYLNHHLLPPRTHLQEASS